jgi:murein DD-endopeptidase MepM/ murein hydrolase activator NlpD
MSHRYLSLSPQIYFPRSHLTYQKKQSKSPFFFIFGILILSQCSVQGPPKVIVLREGEVLAQQGDTVYSLAHKYGVPVRGLVETNGLVAPFTLSPNQKLVLPSSTSSLSSSTSSRSSFQERSSQGPQLLEGGSEVQWEEVQPVDSSKVSQNDISDANPSLMEEARKSEAVMSQKEKKSVPGRASSQAKKGGVGDVGGKKQVCFSSPVKNKKMRPKENGVCLTVNPGEKVHAAAPGKVLFAGSRTTSEDPLVLVQHDNGFLTAYGPFEKISVSKDQCVTSQTALGTIKPGKELYFEMRKDRKIVDAMVYIR